MENTDNTQQIDKELEALKEKLLADARKKIEKKSEALRAKIAKQVAARAACAQSKAELKAKALEVVAKSGFKNAAELLRAITPALPLSDRRKLGVTAPKQAVTRRGPGKGLTPEERAEIYRLRQEGASAKEVAERFHLAVNTVYNMGKKPREQ